jgi:hypothetical protein
MLRTPLESARASAASTTRWTWSRCTEKWTTRNRSGSRRAAREIARRTVGNTNWLRKGAMRARSVTWTGSAARCTGRASCGVFGRGPGLRPAPRRAPPQVNGKRNGNCAARLPLPTPDILNQAIATFLCSVKQAVQFKRLHYLRISTTVRASALPELNHETSPLLALLPNPAVTSPHVTEPRRHVSARRRTPPSRHRTSPNPAVTHRTSPNPAVTHRTSPNPAVTSPHVAEPRRHSPHVTEPRRHVTARRRTSRYVVPAGSPYSASASSKVLASSSAYAERRASSGAPLLSKSRSSATRARTSSSLAASMRSA